MQSIVGFVYIWQPQITTKHPLTGEKDKWGNKGEARECIRKVDLSKHNIHTYRNNTKISFCKVNELIITQNKKQTL